MSKHVQYTRRGFSAAFAATGALTALGCSRKAQSQSGAGANSGQGADDRTMLVYRDPSCGCCEAWAEIARTAGFAVTVRDHPNMPAIKKQYGVPAELASCHTAIVGGYAIEGHVPLEHVARLIETKPGDLRGLAVGGMPRGSPGMEMPDGSKDPFQVMSFDKAGRSAPFEA